MNNTYQKLKARNYKEYKTCQLPGCNNPIEKLLNQKVRKYCSKEHAKEAQKLYLIHWRHNNRDRVSEWNKRYSLRNKKKKREGIII